MNKKNILLITIILFTLLTYIFHKEKFLIPVSKTEILMDTVVTVKVYGKGKKFLEKTVDKVFRKMKTLEILLNNYDNRSEIFKINKNAGISPVKVSKTTVEFLTASKNLCLKTGKFLDISIGYNLNLWGFAKKKPHVPSSDEIKKSLMFKGIDFIKIDKKKSTVYIVRKGISIDVGAVAKGFIIDKAVEFLKTSNIKKAVVNAGGDIRFIGFKDGKKLWKVGIRDPLSKKESDVIKIIKVGNRAVVTSGDYERYFIKNGKKYHHIINPFTGYPARKVHSVTVTADTAFLADGLATAIFVMGDKLFFKKYFKKFKDYNHFRVIIIKDKDKIIDSKNLKALQ